MKKFIAIVAGAFILFSCAAIQVKDTKLIAKYYRTVATKAEYITEQHFPSKDFFWVLEEERNGDNIKVPLVWSDYVNNAIGVVFDHVNTEKTDDVCAVLDFGSNDEMELFQDTFNIKLIKRGTNIPCEYLLKALMQQLEKPIPRTDVG